MSHVCHGSRRRLAFGVAVPFSLALVLAGCTNQSSPVESEPTSESPTESVSEDANGTADDVVEEETQETAVEEDAAPSAGMEDVDLENMEWIFRPGGNIPETVQVPLVDGEASVDFVQYTLGEAVYADVNDDGLADAAAPLRALDGNAVDEQWYMWIATGDEPIQVTLPIARTASCGTATESVNATGDGFEIHEFRRGIDEEALPCSDHGSDERIRTVAAVEARNIDEWWPVQTSPTPGFGGLCPTAIEWEAYPHEGAVHVAPDSATDAVSGVVDGSAGVFGLEGWPVYGEDFPGWALVGLVDGDQLSCAWAEVE